MANYYKPYFKDGSSITLDGKCTNVKIENGIFGDYAFGQYKIYYKNQRGGF